VLSCGAYQNEVRELAPQSDGSDARGPASRYPSRLLSGPCRAVLRKPGMLFGVVITRHGVQVWAARLTRPPQNPHEFHN